MLCFAAGELFEDSPWAVKTKSECVVHLFRTEIVLFLFITLFGMIEPFSAKKMLRFLELGQLQKKLYHWPCSRKCLRLFEWKPLFVAEALLKAFFDSTLPRNPDDPTSSAKRSAVWKYFVQNPDTPNWKKKAT